MENSLKQRIIGAIVLAALAVIFLPAILKEKTEQGTFESKIPEQPKELQEYRVDTQKIDKLISNKNTSQSEQLETSQLKAGKDLPKQAEVNKSEKQDESLKTEAPVKRKTKSKVTESTQAVVNKKSREQKTPESQKTRESQKTALTQSKKASETKQTINDSFTSAAWVVQVASFSNESNAVKLVTKLKNNKFKAYRRKVSAGGKQVYRVFVGPYINKADASKASVKISKVSETKVDLRAFDPLKH